MTRDDTPRQKMRHTMAPRRRTPSLSLGCAAALGLALCPAVASAQTAVGTDTGLDAQLFWPASGAGEHLGLRGPGVARAGDVGFGLVFNAMRNPLMLAPVGGGQRAAAIDWALTADFLWHVGLGRRVQLSAAIPVVLAQDGLGSTPVLGAAGSVLGDTALRDLRLEASVALVQRARRIDARGPGVRLDLGLALPIGEERAFQSSSRVTFAPMLVADWRLPQFTFTANLGARLRTQSAAFADFSVGSQGFIGIGVAFRPARTGNLSRLGLAVDYVNLLPFTSREGFKTTTPQEVFVGARYATDAARDIEVFAGGGIPLGSDPLTPAWRLLAGVSYAPRGNDTDGDGVVDADDRCREQPEDRDGYEDEDGCPDPDNDHDRIPDVRDRCPNEPETYNAHEDEDGCPDQGLAVLEENNIRILQAINFETNSAQILPESLPIVEAVAATLRANPQITRIQVQGHADERGNDDHNLQLTRDRSASVMRALVERGIEAGRLSSAGYGERCPVDAGHNAAAWARNRRVVFLIVRTSNGPTRVELACPAAQDLIPEEDRTPP